MHTSNVIKVIQLCCQLRKCGQLVIPGRWAKRRCARWAESTYIYK